MALIHTSAELVSLALTLPCVALCMRTCWYWWRAARIAWRTPAAQRKAEDWFCLGVEVGFVGNGLDNIYWGLAWTASYVDSPIAGPLFMAGVYANIPFRQIATSYAAYCHCRAYEVSSDAIAKTWRNVVYSSILGVVYVIAIPFLWPLFAG